MATPITTTQKYLHALPDADAKNLDALNRIRSQHGGASGGEHSNPDKPTNAQGDDS